MIDIAQLLAENGILWAQRGKQIMAFRTAKDRIEYFVACVTEFAKAFGLDSQKSFDYLDKHHGMDFLVKCYEAELDEKGFVIRCEETESPSTEERPADLTLRDEEPDSDPEDSKE